LFLSLSLRPPESSKHLFWYGSREGLARGQIERDDAPCHLLSLLLSQHDRRTEIAHEQKVEKPLVLEDTVLWRVGVLIPLLPRDP
jgi:hypothetical protein